MARQKESIRIEEEDGPFRYNYVSVLAVPGLNLESKTEPIALTSFPKLGSQVLLTHNCDAYFSEIDRSTAIAVLLLTALTGSRKFRRWWRYWEKFLRLFMGADVVFAMNFERQTRVCRENRVKEFAGPGCFLVYVAQGDVIEPPYLETTRRIGNTGFGFDIIDGKKYRDRHRSALHSAATSLSVALADTNGTPDTKFLADGLYLKGRENLVIYCKTAMAGNVGLITTNQSSTQSIESANAILPALVGDSKIETAVSLFVQSQKMGNDNLRAFIPAWSALELLINRLERLNRSSWPALLQSLDGLPKWDKDLRQIPADEYRMRDRFYLVACAYNIDTAEDDSRLFAFVNDRRSGFYHRGDVSESELPTTEARKLFRKYLRLSIGSVSGVQVAL